MEKSLGGTVSFAYITQHQEPYQVSRTFLTTFMLCNDGKISFCQNNGCSEGCKVHDPKSLKINFLDSNLASPVDNYLAPSVQEMQSMTG